MKDDRYRAHHAGPRVAVNADDLVKFASQTGFVPGVFLIVVLCLIVYCRVPWFEFLNWDDNVYVVRRHEIRNGVTLAGLRWAFSTFETSNWHPLVWISHMCEIQLFGVSSGVMHTVNLALHLTNAVLVACLIRRLTGSLVFALAVSAFFSLHPQHVEVVAWVSERKELLCVLFGLMTLLAWQSCRIRFRRRTWIAAHVFYALSLFSKQMLVTLPFLMVVLEFFPLNSNETSALGIRSLPKRILNKAGFFTMAFVAVAAAFAAQSSGGAIADGESLPLWLRFANAPNSIAAYIGQTFLPLHLSPFYRHPQSDVSIFQVLYSTAVLLAISVVVWIQRKQPGLVAGWLWFLGTLVPVLGIVQLGAAARADRYTYFPHIGLFLMLVAVVSRLCPRWNRIVATAFLSGLLIFSVKTYFQSAVWRNSISLWQSVLDTDADSYRAHEHLAAALLEADRLEDAITEAKHALCYPENRQSGQSDLTLGTALLKSGRPDESVEFLQNSVRLLPNDAVAAMHLGFALRDTAPAESIALFRRACALDPFNVEAIANLANIEARRGNLAAAIELYRGALKISLDDARLKDNLRIIEEAAGQGH